MTAAKPLPTGWKWENIGSHIADFRPGIARGEKSRWLGFPHLRMNNVSNHLRLSLDELWRIPASEEEQREFALLDDDILFNNTNSRDLVGKCCMFHPPSAETFLFSNHITRIRTKSSLAPGYLVFWVNYLWRRGFFRDKCDVWVNQAAVRVEDLLFPTKLPLPATVDEQKQIAQNIETKLQALEMSRVAAGRQLEAVTAMPAAVLRDFFNLQGNDNGQRQ